MWWSWSFVVLLHSSSQCIVCTECYNEEFWILYCFKTLTIVTENIIFQKKNLKYLDPVPCSINLWLCSVDFITNFIKLPRVVCSLRAYWCMYMYHFIAKTGANGGLPVCVHVNILTNWQLQRYCNRMISVDVFLLSLKHFLNFDFMSLSVCSFSSDHCLSLSRPSYSLTPTTLILCCSSLMSAAYRKIRRWPGTSSVGEVP